MAVGRAKYKSTIFYRKKFFDNFLTSRGIKKSVKQGLMKLIGYWHVKFLPRHFEENATNRYKYARRTRRYEKRKQKLFGHKKPLVWSGDAQRMARRKIRITGTSKGAAGTMDLPKYFYAYLLAGKTIDKVDELIRTTRKELKEQAKVLDAYLQEEVNVEGPFRRKT